MARRCYERSAAVINRLLPLLRRLDPDDLLAARHELMSLRHEWYEQWVHPDATDELWELSEEYKLEAEVSHVTTCRTIIEMRLGPLFESLRRVFEKRLASRQGKAFGLGELLDQGIRPGDVYHRLKRSGRELQSLYRGLDDDEWFERMNEHSASSCWFADTERHAGELAPDPAWLEELKVTAEQAGIASDVLAEVDSPVTQLAQQRVELIERIAEDIRRCLAEQKPEWDPTARQLWYRGELAREYRHTASRQEAIIRAFDDAGWPELVENPFRDPQGKPDKHALKQTVTDFNRANAAVRLIIRGANVGWVSSATSNSPGRDQADR